MTISMPLYASAGLISFITELISGEEKSASSVIVNSQNMALLQATVNPDPLSGRGGGDITIVNGTALLPESGPNGSLADVVEGSHDAGTISIYVVRKGDTLSGIAKMYNVSVNTIVWGNDLRSGLIREGQTLIILPISGVQHTVVKGDTIQTIAKKYKADIDEILGYNGLPDNVKLAVGDTIIVPDGEIPAPKPLSSGTTSGLRGAGGPDLSGYYLRPLINGRRTQGLHGYNGVDLANYVGAPVLAAAEGQVIIARGSGYNGGYGSYVVIAHPNGTQTLYAHLSAVSVSSGEPVVRGQVIGNVGSTGKSTGPHLHFEVRGAKNPF